MSDPTITAMILAPDNGGLQPVFRVPAIRRLVILLGRAGIQRIHLLGDTRPLEPVLSDLLPAEGFHRLENGVSPDQPPQAPALAENDICLVLRADLVIDRDSLPRMLAEAGKGRPLFMPAASGESADGIYIVGAGDVAPVFRRLWSPTPSAAVPPEFFTIISGFAGLPCRAGTDASGRILSEEGLVRALNSRTRADDGFMARYVDRHISLYFSRRLAHTAVSPNQISLVGMTIGLAGAFFLSLPGYGAHLLGAVLFVFCVIIDGMDGEVARLKLMESNFGHTLDIVSDNIVHVAIFIGIAVGLYRDTGSLIYLHALVILMGGFALAATAVCYCILKLSTEQIRQSPLILRLLALLANRDFAYLILLLALCNRLAWFFWGSVAGTYIFAGLLVAIRLLETGKLKQLR